MQHDAPHGRLYPCAEFHQVFAQGADLGGSQGRAVCPQTQLLVEHIGGGAQQPPQMIGEEAVAAGALDFQAMMQFFDPILDVPAGAVDRFVQISGRVLAVGDHEARVVFELAPGMTHGLGFDDDAAAKPPSKRTRNRARGTASRSLGNSRERMPIAPTPALALPGRST